MANVYKTPGVYVEEIPKLPASIAQVETAIPAFIGYTEKAEKPNGDTLLNIPFRISSMVDFELYFGGSAALDITSVTIDENFNTTNVVMAAQHYLYDSMQLFYKNGGGDCYIVSVGSYGDPIQIGNGITPGFLLGLKKLEKADEPTIILFPDASLLSDPADLYELQKQTLLHCSYMQDRFGVFDTENTGTIKTDKDNFRNGIGMNDLKYGAAYYPWLKANIAKNVGYDDLQGKIKRANVSIPLTSMTEDAEAILNATRLDRITTDNLQVVDDMQNLFSPVSTSTDADKLLAEIREGYQAAFDSFSTNSEEVVPALPGTITFNSGSMAVVGVGALFLTNVAVGDDLFYYDGTNYTLIGEVDVITDNNNIILLANSAVTGAAVKYYANDTPTGTSKAEALAELLTYYYKVANLANDWADTAGGSDFTDTNTSPGTDIWDDVTNYYLDSTQSFITATFKNTVNTLLRADIEAKADGILPDTLFGDFTWAASVWGTLFTALPAASTIFASNSVADLKLAEGDVANIFEAIFADFNTIVQTGIETSKNLETAVQNQIPAYKNIVQAVSTTLTTLPPSGAIAGIYAYVDRTRGVWKAPANVSLNGVVELTQTIENREQESLNVDVTGGKSINCIRAFTGKGILVWGARTLAGNDLEWRYVPVRRLFIMIEESIKKATEFVVFEPNDANTWVRVKGMINNFLTEMWKNGALAGAKPEHAFFVNCGLGETMTSIDILEGKLIVEIGLAAVRPAEFIILRFSHKLQES